MQRLSYPLRLSYPIRSVQIEYSFNDSPRKPKDGDLQCAAARGTEHDVYVHHDYELVKVLKSLFGHEKEVLVIK